MTQRDKDSSDEVRSESGETGASGLPSPSPERLKASLANLRKNKEGIGLKLPSPSSSSGDAGSPTPDARLRIPSPSAGPALDEDSEPELGTDRIEAESLEALSMSEVSFVTEDSDAEEDDARTAMISGDLAAQFALEDGSSASPVAHVPKSAGPAKINSGFFAPLDLPDEDDEPGEARTEMVSGNILEALDIPAHGLEGATVAEDDYDDGDGRTEMFSAAQLGLDDDAGFIGEKTQLADSPFAFPQQAAAAFGAGQGANLGESTQPKLDSYPGATLEPLSASVPAPQAPARPHSQPEDDFHGEKTELYESPFENEAIFPKLSVLEGPVTGQEFLVNRLRNTVGRGTNNTIIVGDLAMSRQHFEIQQSPDESYILRDLNSVNGTQLNGARVKEADLLHGDRIEAGKTVFQFVIPGTAPQPVRQRRVVAAGLTETVTDEPAQRPPRLAEARPAPGLQKTLLYTTMAAVGLSVLLVVAIIVVSGRDGTPAAPAMTASQVYMQGVEAVQARDWTRAEERFRMTLELEPQFESVAAQLARIQQERTALATIEEARGAIDGQPSEALLTRLEAIGRQSVYYDEAGQLLRQLRNRHIFAAFEKAQQQARSGEHQLALATIDEILDAVPRHEGALALKADVSRRIEEARAQEVAQAQAAQAQAAQEQERSAPTAQAQVESPRNEQAARTERAPREASTTKSRTTNDDDDWTIEPVNRPRTTASKTESGSSRPAPVVNFTEGFRLYQAREFTAAANHFQAIADGSDGALAQRAGRLASDVRRFERSFNAANEAMGARRYSQAVRHLDEAKRMDTSIAGNNSAFQRVLSNMLATAHGELGLTALSDGDIERAKTHLRQGKANNGSDAAVQRLERDLAGR
jgi:pSer/pThr/pTyr-binding forkhead associated (FHA) protein